MTRRDLRGWRDYILIKTYIYAKVMGLHSNHNGSFESGLLGVAGDGVFQGLVVYIVGFGDCFDVYTTFPVYCRK